jgi:dTMP kinase
LSLCTLADVAFIVFEGLDGSGKSTLIKKLDSHLKSKGVKTLVTREPGGTPLSEELREILIRTTGDTPSPRTELLLYEAARSQHVDRVIQPFLNQKGWVLCDRFTASSVAFQSGGRGINREQVDWLNDFATSELKPDLQVLLDLTYEVSMQRRTQRTLETGQESDRFEKEKREFHESVRNTFLGLAKADPKSWIVLDATLDPNSLFEQLLKTLQSRVAIEPGSH